MRDVNQIKLETEVRALREMVKSISRRLSVLEKGLAELAKNVVDKERGRKRDFEILKRLEEELVY